MASVSGLSSRGEADFDLYPYTPSAPAGYAFLVLFGIGGVVHLSGYYARAWSHSNIRNGSPYLIQLMLILASAPLLAATIYMTLGRLVRALDAAEHAFLSPRWTTRIYVLIDIGSFISQMMGER
ncbi:hypothetical protein N0V90_002281 [Kalmusia sp. IMI 367209]|nr:hypothetical protein N0V90_002281 [Kalmusia sp. IMI 367209]